MLNPNLMCSYKVKRVGSAQVKAELILDYLQAIPKTHKQEETVSIRHHH